MMRSLSLTISFIFLFFSSLPMAAGASSSKLKVETVIRELDSPWAIAFLPSGKEMLVTLKNGKILLINLTNQEVVSTIDNFSDSSIKGQGGLLDIETHPQFSKKPWIYVSYTKKVKSGYTTALARGLLGTKKLSDIEVLFTAKAIGGGGRHFGSRLAFDERGYLYMSIGDRGERELAQNLQRHNGKIIRLHDDGRTPKDNPFVNRSDVLPEIFTYGHRNPQGMVFDKLTNRLWIHEHGPRGGDEINLVQAGKNYGWPVVTHGREYYGPKISEKTEMEGIESPVYVWVPSIAPSGMDIYNHKLFPNWNGSLLIGALKDQLLAKVRMNGVKALGEERYLESMGERIRDVKMGPDGAIYIITDGRKGKLWRVLPG